MEFSVGDLVYLKSGGHAMVIRDIAAGKAVCQWSAAGQLESTTFPVAMLTGDQPGSGVIQTFREHEDWDALTEKVAVPGSEK